MLERLRKLTMKQWMLIIMSTLLVLMVVMAAIVIDQVMDMLTAFVGGGEDPSTSESITQEPSTAPETEPSYTEEATEPTQTEPEESTQTHVHEFVKEKTTAATCTSMGYTIYKCSCGKTDVRDFREQLGHQYQEAVVEQTCEQEGCTMKSCIRCGDVQKTDVKPALGHDYQTIKTVTADCEQEGYEEKECSRCHGVIRDHVQAALGHAYGEWVEVKAATDVAAGERKHTCANCQKVETQVLPATGDFKINSTAMSNEDEAWTYYRIQVGTKNTPYAYTFSIYIGLENRSITYTYSKEGGLVVNYTGANGTQLQEKLDAYADGVLTIDKDGKVSSKAPNVATVPTEPSTAPSESTEPSASTAPGESTESGAAEPTTPATTAASEETTEPTSAAGPKE